MERVNLRHLKGLPEPVDVATLDVSFISVLKASACALCVCAAALCCSHKPLPAHCAAQVMPAVRAVLRPNARLLVLIKPQFEARRGEVRPAAFVLRL
jgi:23S rRNA (cytidine1920-2'-O)/16S rRNA (cytidine1409-2'-O)-methyltransferase